MGVRAWGACWALAQRKMEFGFIARGMACAVAATGSMVAPGAAAAGLGATGGLRAFYAPEESAAAADAGPVLADALAGAAAAPPPASSGVSQTGRAFTQGLTLTADYLYGLGTVTLPFFYSLNTIADRKDENGKDQFKNQVRDDAPRQSDYFGATLSYSPVPAWSIEFSYLNGDSSGNANVPFDPDQFDIEDKAKDSRFTIKDDWYQLYARYNFPGLRGRRLKAYMRLGVSYVQTEMTDETYYPELGFYRQKNEGEDILGNLGFGLSYSVYAGDRLKLGLQFEGEGFYGHRSQDILETITKEDITEKGDVVTLDDDLFGGLGRLTLRGLYELGATGAWTIFGDIGMQAKYTVIQYDVGSRNELLWGPYVKLGVRYSF